MIHTVLIIRTIHQNDKYHESNDSSDDLKIKLKYIELYA